VSPKGTSHTNFVSEWENTSFIQQISPYNKTDGFFVNYIGVQELKNELEILKFDILRVPPIQISTKKG
jgi:hypothetical protein